MKRIVSVWLIDWPITVWSRTAGRSPPPEDAPFVLTERTARGLIVHALNPAARALGMFRGQAHADACAIAPHLMSAEAEPQKEAEALSRLAVWAERFSPTVALDRAFASLEGLFIDMTGGAHLFGGEAALLAELSRRLGAMGGLSRCVIADTPGAAWAQARFGVLDLIPPGGARSALCDLTVEALRLDPAAVLLLSRLGLKRIGDLYALPRAGLARRFRGEGALGLSVVQSLDMALGLAPEPLVPERAPPRYRAPQVFAEPLLDAAGVGFVLPDLTGRLCTVLERDGQGARAIRLTAFRVDGGTTSIEATLSAPTARPAHLLRLLKERGLEHLDLGFGADALMLSALSTEPLIVRQTDMTARDAVDEAALAGLIDRLRARLGDGAVRRSQLLQSWIPELSEAWLPIGDAAATPADGAHERPRPILMLHPPQLIEAIAEAPDGPPARFTWRRVARRIVRASGPERISPEWWRKAGARLGLANEPRRTRDYYRVEDEAGRGYWLFREGLFLREDVSAHDDAEDRPLPRPPTWWLHGLFP